MIVRTHSVPLVARKLPIVYGPTTEIACQPYRCKLSARACAVRHKKSQTTMSLIEMRKGLHLRGPDLSGCVGCEVGAYVVKRLAKLALDAAVPEAQTVKPKRWLKPARPA